jgi:hypothetical protein
MHVEMWSTKVWTIKAGLSEQRNFRKPGKQVVVYPDEYKTGDVITPFEKARSAK